MSRELDLDKLDIDDVRYMRQRPNLIAEAKLLGVDDIEERLAEVEEAEAEAPVDYVKDNTLPGLRALADARGVDGTGSKAKIAERLLAQDRGEDLVKAPEVTQTPSVNDGGPGTQLAPVGEVGQQVASEVDPEDEGK